jgi:hypothetical protein
VAQLAVQADDQLVGLVLVDLQQQRLQGRAAFSKRLYLHHQLLMNNFISSSQPPMA